MSEVRLDVEQRTEFGKGAARRTRRAGKVPAVLYGHGSEPRHLALPALEFNRVLREHGRNAVLTLQVGDVTELALTKTVTTHPIRSYVEHVDLLLIRRGEKVNVEIAVVLVGEAAPGTLITQEMNRLEVAVDAMDIPEQFEVSVQGARVGTQVLARDVPLPDGVELRTDPEYLVANVVEAPSEKALEAELDLEGAGVRQDAPDAESSE